jgi:hypothetical protein
MGLKEVQYADAIENNSLAELIDGVAHVLELKNYNEYADALKTIAKSIREQVIESMIKNR